jgi:hypothetical protein
MITNLEGNTFSTDQLGDLIQSALTKTSRASAPAHAGH